VDEIVRSRMGQGWIPLGNQYSSVSFIGVSLESRIQVRWCVGLGGDRKVYIGVKHKYMFGGENMRSFSEWKTITIRKLLEMRKRYSDNGKILQDINVLVSKLQYLKARDLGAWLVLLHHAATDSPEFLELAPSVEELEEWFEKEE